MTVPVSVVNSAQPRIRRAPGIVLTAQQEALLQQRFTPYAEIFAEQSFHSGYSGAAVYLVSRDPDAPVVVKFAHPFELQREVAAYTELVERTAPQNTARLQGDLLTGADGQLGLIVYSFAGGNLHTGANSFATFFQTHGGQAAARVFDHLLGSYGRQWWASNELRRIVYAEEYDRLLPVQLVLRAVDTSANVTVDTQVSPVLIRAGETSSLLLRTLRPGQRVQLEGLRVVKTQADRLTLHADPPPGERSAPLRLRLAQATASYQPGDLLPVQAALVETTRWELLAASAQAALASFDADQDRFVVQGVPYLNPLRYLTATLDRTEDLRVSIVHGDLNLQNILVDPVSTFAWLIDFAETHRGPTLFDLQRMEVQVIAKLLLPYLPRSTQAAALLASLLDTLHTPVPTLLCPVPALQESYTLLVTLREWARQFLVDDRQWAEYYRGLLLALIGALKFDELDVTARGLVLVGAAKAAELLDKPLTTPIDPAPGQPPYKGLQAFDRTDAELFFGREQLIGELLAHVQQEPFLAIVGPSGSGKSSLVRAGLGAALASQPTWSVTLITPTAQPLSNLTTALAQRPTPARHWLLVVDQFEELFTLCRDKNERQLFVTQLLAVAGLSSPITTPVATVLITLRADFYADCAEFERLRAALARWQTYIGPLSPAELRRAIAEPAQRNGWAIEPDLIELLLRDVGNEPGALPLLAQALLETWNRRRGRLLTVAGYVASGSVQGAIARTAETVYKERLLPEQQPVARQIFLELTEIGESGQNTRRRVTQPDLLARAGAAAQPVLDTLAQARLIIVAEHTVEVAHEALIREWPLLQSWIEADRAALRAHRQLTQAAQEWEQLARDPDLLYRGVRLAQALEYQQAGAIYLNSAETAFLQASIALRDQESVAKERQRQLELMIAQEKATMAEARAHKQAHQARRLRRLAILLGLLLLLPLTIGWLALRRYTSAWQPVENFPQNAVLDLVVAPADANSLPPRLCVGTSDVGIGCSQDGRTWNLYQQNLPTGAPAIDNAGAFPATVRAMAPLAFDQQNTQRLFAYAKDHGVYYSPDNGLTWQTMGAGLPPELEGRVLVASGDYAFLVGEPMPDLYVSTGVGSPWEKVNQAGSGLPERVLAVQIDSGHQRVYVGGTGGLYSSVLRVPWQWRPEADLIAVEWIEPVLNQPGSYYLSAYDETALTNTIYYFQADQPFTPTKPLITLAGRVKALAPYSQPDQPIAAYVLLCNRFLVACQVIAITQQGEQRKLGNRPLWWLPISYDLLAIPQPWGAGVQLLLGHDDGLLEYTLPPN